MKRTEEFVFEYLLGAGLQPKHDGFAYLTGAVLCYLRRPAPFMEVYRAVGDRHGKTPAAVRKSIKNAVDSAILRSGNENADLYGLQSADSGSVRTSEFIALSAQRIRLLMAGEAQKASLSVWSDDGTGRGKQTD